MQPLGNHTILVWNVLCCVSIVGFYMTCTVPSLHLDNIVQTFCTLWQVTHTRQTPVLCVCDCMWVSERSHSICQKSTSGKLSTAVRDCALWLDSSMACSLGAYMLPVEICTCSRLPPRTLKLAPPQIFPTAI